MPREIQHYLAVRPGGVYVDCTLGGSGHARNIIEQLLPDGLFIGIDQDKDAIENAEKVLNPFSGNTRIFHDNFSALPLILNRLKIEHVDGILLDLGLSLHQLRQGRRGFSFQMDEDLDMRMDIRHNKTAADIVNTSSERDLVNLFFTYGEERMSRRIARQIVDHRRQAPIRTSKELARIVLEAIPEKMKHTQKIHPATRIFQALRIAVNQELEVLEGFMKILPSLLKVKGRACVISFHSLEDRIVKQHFRSFEKGCVCPREFPVCQCGFVPQLKVITRKPVVPDESETRRNPMARSAKLRVAEKV